MSDASPVFLAQYTELWTALDIIAERIRTLGYPAPGSYRLFVELSSIPEGDGVPKAKDMIRQLVVGQEVVARTSRRVFAIVSKANVQPSAGLPTQRMEVHEEMRGC